MEPEPSTGVQTLGRYAIYGKIAAGGMASVYYGRQRGDAGFSRVVAVKRMLPRFAKDPQFVAMFLDEATLASRIQHPNVVSTLDLVADGSEILIVMEYVRALSLSALLARAREREPVPVPIAASAMMGVLAGLHAAHEARGKKGESLQIVHRDVSPQNILVGADGIARIMDFGIAKATQQLHTTGEGQIRGKLSYMAPEQLASGGRPVDRGADVFAAGVVLWGMLAGQRLFHTSDVADTVSAILTKPVPPLSTYRSDVPAELEAAIRRALERDRDRRWPTARDLEEAIAAACPRLATQRAVGAWVEALGGDVLSERDVAIAAIESAGDDVPASLPLAGATAHEEEPSLDAATLERDPPRPEPAAARPVGPDPAPAGAPRKRRAWAIAPGIAVLGPIAVAITLVGLSGEHPDTRRADSPSSSAPAASAPPPEVEKAAVPEPSSEAAAPTPTASASPVRSPSPPRPPTIARSAKSPTPPPPHPSARGPGDPGFLPERP